MTEKQLYRQCDTVVGPYLVAIGFRPVRSGEYLRRVSGGEDRIAFSKGPPSRGGQFAVFMSYYPDYIAPVFDLIDYGGEDRGFPMWAISESGGSDIASEVLV